MIFRNLDINHDFTFGRGKQDYLTENTAIMKNIETTLKTFYSECFFNTGFGIAWFSLLGQKNTDLLLLSLKTAILNCENVTKIGDVLFHLNAERVATISYSVSTIYSQSVMGGFVL